MTTQSNARPTQIIESPIDLDRIRLASDGDVEFEIDLLGIYVEDTERRLYELAKVLPSADASAIRTLAHTIKGASASIGAGAMQRIAERLEYETGRGDVSQARDDLDALRSALSGVKDFVQTYAAHR